MPTSRAVATLRRRGRPRGENRKPAPETAHDHVTVRDCVLLLGPELGEGVTGLRELEDRIVPEALGPARPLGDAALKHSLRLHLRLVGEAGGALGAEARGTSPGLDAT